MNKKTFKKTRKIVYYCPLCGRPSSAMDLFDCNYYPSRFEVDKALKETLDDVAHERLKCPCGKILSWFDMLKAEV